MHAPEDSHEKFVALLAKHERVLRAYIYGSNWPVSEYAADYAFLQRIALEYALEKGDAAARKFCALNAKRAYKWIERPGRAASSK